MFEITLQTYLIVLPLIFFAGFVDSIAGGGGLISVPTYLVVGLPPHIALGNNKFSSTFGTVISTSRYFKHKLIDLKIALISAVFALIGSHLGTKTVLLLNPHFLNYFLLILIPMVTIVYFFNRKLGLRNHSHKIGFTKKIVLAISAGLIIGFYDGFFGPGTGSFLILFFTALMHYDFMTANANTKVVNLASNLAALTTFIMHGKVNFAIGIPAAFFGIAGNYVGSKLVIKNGSKLIKPVFLIVLILLFGKITFNLFVRK